MQFFEQLLLYVIKWGFDLKCTWNAVSQQSTEAFLYLKRDLTL